MERRASNRLSIKGAPFELEPFQWMNPHIDIIMLNLSLKCKINTTIMNGAVPERRYKHTIGKGPTPLLTCLLRLKRQFPNLANRPRFG